MPIEFAILPLTHPLTSSNPTLPTQLFQKLQKSKSILEEASGYRFRFFQQIDDPSIIYIIGEWSSVEEHEVFLKSEENLYLLDSLKDDIVMNGTGDKTMQMWHLSIKSDDFTFSPARGGSEKVNILDMPIISITQIGVPESRLSDFGERIEWRKTELEEYDEMMAYGPRIDKVEEWNIISGFGNLSRAITLSFEHFNGRRGCADAFEFEVQHMKAIEGL